MGNRRQRAWTTLGRGCALAVERRKTAGEGFGVQEKPEGVFGGERLEPFPCAQGPWLGGMR